MDSFFALNWSDSLAKWSHKHRYAHGAGELSCGSQPLSSHWLLASFQLLDFHFKTVLFASLDTVIIYTQDQERMSYNVLIPY